MFVVEVVALVTTILLVRELISPTGEGAPFIGQITVWLWFTVLFANFAEAMAEGRGKAQAETLRKTKTQTIAKKLRHSQGREYDLAPATSLRKGDVVLVEALDTIPGDGDVIEGVASVDESAITGESAPVIRESGGDRSAVTGGTRVLSDWIKVRITSNPGETFLDRMIALVEGAQRQKTPNEIALSILLAGLTIIFLLATVTVLPFSIYAGGAVTLTVLIALLVTLIPTTIGGLLSASQGWTALCSITSWPCRVALWRRPVTWIRCCWTKQGQLPWATEWRRSLSPCQASARRNWLTRRSWHR
jgi:K+-transporting ATPase ATPase B chain